MDTPTTTKSVFLAIVPPSGPEVHIRWRGHATVESANTEMKTLRSLLIGQKKKPFDCYIYEAEMPPFGNKVFELDEIDMNFYEENPNATQDMEAAQHKLDQALYEVGLLAEEERKAALKAKGV
jgi:hypothetical protein